MTENTFEKPFVLVFGGAGYIGSHVVRHLLQDGHAVRVVDNMLFGSDGLKDVKNPKLQIIDADLCDVKAVSEATTGADTVILLAAIVGRRVGENFRQTTRDINLLASSVAVDSAIEHGARRFIFTSSDSIYGSQSGLIYETAIPEPVNLYSRLKLRMEERVLNTRRRNFYPTVLRVGTCHGYSARMRFDLIANEMIRDAACKKKVAAENTEQCRAFIHVEDVARAIASCVRAHVNLVGGEIFNVCAADQNMTVGQLAHVVRALVPDAIIEFSDEEPDLVDYRLSSSKIGKVLDFEPIWTMEQSLTEIRDRILEGQFEDPYSFRYSSS